MFLALLLAGSTPSDPLQSAFRAAHRDYSAQLTDKFAETTADPSVIGQRFKFVGRLHNGQVTGAPPSDAWYSYDDGKLRLSFNPRDNYADVGISGPKYMVGIIGGARKPTRSYVGSNAYGLSARVQVERLEENGLAMLERPEGEVSPPSKYSTPMPPSIAARLPPEPKDRYWVEYTLPGPQAKRLARDAGLVVEGTIAALADGKLSYCEGTYIDPKIDNPLEIYGSECWIGAKVSRIAFIRMSTGEVLKEWTAPAGQAGPCNC
ncbi:MAG TPA: hypothetical protein VEB39_02300 [Sphingomicrobium sp.]|nr:hypothetical protein [Sphingomicrobium sp.]